MMGMVGPPPPTTSVGAAAADDEDWAATNPTRKVAAKQNVVRAAIMMESWKGYEVQMMGRLIESREREMSVETEANQLR